MSVPSAAAPLIETLPREPVRDARAAVRVTHVVFDFEGGGLETLVAAMARHFHGSTVQLSLVTLGGRVGRLGAAVRHCFDAFEVVRPLRGVSLAFPIGVARAIRRTRPDVVHIHSGCWLKGARAARLAGVPRVVFTEHGREHDDPWLRRFIDRRAAASTDTVVAVSDRLATYLATRVGIAPGKIRTIHNGIDTTRFTPGPAKAALRASLSIPDDALVIGSVGRLETVKAYDRLLDSTARLRDLLSRPLVVVIAGDGTQRDALIAHARSLGLSDCVRLPGWIEQPVDFYRLLDVFVLSSLSEGQSVSLMESMACGIPPVVTDVGSNAEMLGSELSSQVVPFGDPDAMATALREVVTDAGWRAKIRAIVRQRAVALYSIEEMTTQYERLYRL